MRLRPHGKYTSTVWIPGNFLSEGTLSVGVGLETVVPVIFQFYEPDAISFKIFDSLEGPSARGDYVGDMGGVVRPLLTWTTEFSNGYPLDQIKTPSVFR
jgi:lipopolysaccharide transport system ATP-binding protein